MPAYDAADFRPPAPVAMVTVRSPQAAATIDNVPMLLDSGADVSLLPRAQIAPLIELVPDQRQYELEAFDGSRSSAPVVELELILLGKSFKGQFLLIESPHGILGRNILNSLALLLDGPKQSWDLHR